MCLINFLHPKLKPTVNCNKVCEDAYSADNLVSNKREELQRGFMAFSVTKPPVDLIFDLAISVQVKYIKIWNCLGALKSTGFEIYGKYNGAYEKVGYIRDFQGDSLMFCFSNYELSVAASKESMSITKVLLFKTATRYLAQCDSIKIVITSTKKCPPVLKKVEIWGMPSKTVDKRERETIISTWKTVNCQKPKRVKEDRLAALVDSCSGVSDIPEEFLDSITYELMIFPTVLPSGKVVDQSTIEKHSQNEAIWGRAPSDPFTGVDFTMERKPIIDLALKARIEKFLIQNSDRFKAAPRTLGSKRTAKRSYHASFTETEPHWKLQKSDSISPTDSCSPQSVEEALQNELKKITRFTIPRSKIESNNCTACISCKNSDNLYKIKTCNHLVCRICLNSFLVSKTCTMCKNTFQTGDVERYHS